MVDEQLTPELVNQLRSELMRAVGLFEYYKGLFEGEVQKCVNTQLNASLKISELNSKLAELQSAKTKPKK